MKAVLDLGINGIKAIKTAKCYLIEGRLDDKQLETICSRLLVNPIIQHIVTGESVVFTESPRYIYKLEHTFLNLSVEYLDPLIRHNYLLEAVHLNVEFFYM